VVRAQVGMLWSAQLHVLLDYAVVVWGGCVSVLGRQNVGWWWEAGGSGGNAWGDAAACAVWISSGGVSGRDSRVSGGGVVGGGSGGHTCGSIAACATCTSSAGVGGQDGRVWEDGTSWVVRVPAVMRISSLLSSSFAHSCADSKRMRAGFKPATNPHATAVSTAARRRVTQ
jgi:hypothetical protein